jgi:dCTP deaminase
MGILADYQITGIHPLQPGLKRLGKISYGLSSYGYDARIGYKFKVFTPTFCGIVDPKNFDEKAFTEVDLTPRKDHVYEQMNCIYCGCHRENPHNEEWKEKCGVYLKPWKEECYDEDDPLYNTRSALPNHILIPPNSFVLGETVEDFDIPRDCLAIVLGKSTYARCGIIINVTPLEPQWRGKVTVEISNTAPLPAKVYAGEGIMQVLFFRSDGVDACLRKTVVQLADMRFASKFAEMLHKDATCRTSYADKAGKYQDQQGLKLPEVD